MFEVDVDVGCFAALATDKPLEEQIHAGRIDRCNSQAVTDHRICRRTSSLTKDATAVGKLHQIPDGKKISFVTEFINQIELMLNPLRYFSADSLRVPPPSALPGQLRQVFPRGPPRGNEFFGIFIA